MTIIPSQTSLLHRFKVADNVNAIGILLHLYAVPV